MGLVVLAGCGGSRPELRTSFVEFSPEQKAEIAETVVAEYRLQEGDVLKIAFAYETNLTQDGVVVLSDGSINLVGVDRIAVAGLTVTEADRVVTAAYGKEYREPDLSILIQETQGKRVYVLGEVRNPGLQRIPNGGLNIMGAVGVASGFTDDADPSGVVLVRVTPDGYLVREIDLKNFASVENIGLATIGIEALDIVFVPRSRAGNFSYFTKTVLSGLVSITRLAADIKYISNGGFVRF